MRSAPAGMPRCPNVSPARMQIAGRGTKISPLIINRAVIEAQAKAPSQYDAH